MYLNNRCDRNFKRAVETDRALDEVRRNGVLVYKQSCAVRYPLYSTIQSMYMYYYVDVAAVSERRQRKSDGSTA